MNRFNFLTVSALALGIALGGAVIATAQNQSDPGARPAPEAEMTRADFRGDRGDRGERRGRGHRGARGGEMFRTIFDAADADGDRTVTQAEIDAYRTTRLAEVDASGDGALSIEEFDTLYRDLTRSRMVDAFQALDADGDGQISPEEMDRRVARFVERMDRDGDGALTLQRPGRPAPEAPQE